MTIGVAVGSEMFSLNSPARALAEVGATVIVNPAAAAETVGRGEMEAIKLMAESHTLSAVIVTALAGEGESGTDGIYSGESKIAERGRLLAVAEKFSEDGLIFADCDLDAILGERARTPGFERDCNRDYITVGFDMKLSDTALTGVIDNSPFLPEDREELNRRCELILDIQSHALADRISRSMSNGSVPSRWATTIVPFSPTLLFVVRLADRMISFCPS